MRRPSTPTEIPGKEIEDLLTQARRVAVLGASAKTDRPAHYVPQYLHERGFQIWAVNPRLAGQSLWGHEAVAELPQLSASAPPMDLVVVFRRPDLLEAHLPELLAMEPLPRAVWFQRGIRNDDVADRLRDAGLIVIQDHCMMADHKALRTAA
jgi:predicted CoA-binding protein